MAQKSTSGYLTINEAVVEYSLSPVWVRRMVHQEKVDFIRVQVGDTKVSRIEISIDSLDKRASMSKSRRTDGRNKFTVYATSEEFKTLQTLLSENGLDIPIGRANPSKDQKAKDLKALKDSLETS